MPRPDVVPVITTQLEYDRNKVRTAIGLGSVIPLAAILAWLAINDNSMIRANSFGEPLLSLAREFGHGAGMRTFALGLEAFTCLSMTCGFILTSITVADFVSYELTRARRLATIGNIVDLSPKPTTLDFESHFEGAMFGAQVWSPPLSFHFCVLLPLLLGPAFCSPFLSLHTYLFQSL